jgi:hypothetical protein
MKARKRLLAFLLSLVVSALATSGSHGAPSEGCPVEGTLSEYEASDPSAPAITEENLFASERFWPYQTELTSAWQAPGREPPLPAGAQGVLVRLESPAVARIDFGRRGVFEVPVDVTDLVNRSNRVRRGELEKIGPNFFHAVGSRLVDSASEEPGAFDLKGALGCRGYLAVFADPEGGRLGELALALGSLREHDDVLTILFPQGRHPDLEVREALRSLMWEIPFVLGYLSEGYTESILNENAKLPAVVLQTPEGRVLMQRSWKPGLAEELSAAIENAFGQRTAVMR